MSSTRTSKTARQRKTVARKSTTRSASRTPKPSKKRRSNRKKAMPDWGTLSGSGRAGSKRVSKAKKETTTSLSLSRFWGWLWLVAAGYILYVGHVQATKGTYNEVQQLQRENLDLNLRYNQLKAELDGATGPKVIYNRAKALGLEEGYAYGPTIHVK